MVTCLEFAIIQMTFVRLDKNGLQIGEERSDCLAFPESLRTSLTPILANYGYGAEDAPGTDDFLSEVEYGFDENSTDIPWALIFFDKEYPLGGHLLSIRRDRDLRFGNYTAYNRKAVPKAAGANKAPPLSIVFVFTKEALEAASLSQSPLLGEAWDALRDKDGARRWAVVCGPIEPEWVRAMSLVDDALYAESVRKPKSCS